MCGSGFLPRISQTVFFLGNIGEIMSDFHYHRPHHRIQDIAKRAQEIVTLNHQYGEGWLIRLEPQNPADLEQLLGSAEYSDYIGAEAE